MKNRNFQIEINNLIIIIMAFIGIENHIELARTHHFNYVENSRVAQRKLIRKSGVEVRATPILVMVETPLVVV